MERDIYSQALNFYEELDDDSLEEIFDLEDNSDNIDDFYSDEDIDIEDYED
ncbi:MAG TPA: hypothetical protein P5513_05810 [Candidatus Diapherotrites archaeon]|nr:hypothetical protein [Candidatus Diapherotrites archaeon]